MEPRCFHPGMDPRLLVTRDEFLDVQMDLRRFHTIQQHQSERLRLLEKRQADDAALRSVWNSPFPSALGGTPQHGPVHMPTSSAFDDLDEQSQTFLGSLPLGGADDEPIRRGAASRANSVRFDESALQASSWAGQAGRQTGDLAGPIRPSSGLGGHQMMERSMSHKSDGRHSSAGHSAHSGLSGRASSLGLDTNFAIGGHEDESPLDIPEPPPGFYFLGSAPSIIRCWLSTEFTSGKLLYAVVCTGSQKSTVEYSLLKELKLANTMHREVDGIYRVTLPVFLAEASVTQSNSRSASPVPQLPSIMTSFEVTGPDVPESPPDAKKSIRVFIGSSTLRQHSADLLLSQNIMTLYGSDRDKLSVPFVRPEDDSTFLHLATTNLVPEKPKLNAAAPEFVLSEVARKPTAGMGDKAAPAHVKTSESGSQGPLSPTSQSSQRSKTAEPSVNSDSGGEREKQAPETTSSSEEGAAAARVPPAQEESASAETAARREASSTAMRIPWRQTAMANSEGGQREGSALGGYQAPSRAGRMKILKPSKPGIASLMRTGAGYEPAAASRSSSEFRRKKAPGGAGSQGENRTAHGASTLRWGDGKRSVSAASAAAMGAGDWSRSSAVANTTEAAKPTPLGKSTNNPLGSASAFSWIDHGGKPKSSTAAD
ncbi:hypothetical protein P8C59_004803 [Phyllachora maydis]|uniref:Ubiquitin carboxyl-terminal hydrolase 19 n=1 Tax=Phyllachora maydis TaxID=1825666 RepID=A0AAD9I4W0_9PEZI|nr:hypothetical protein P8C59_004803 [Phyllachora maydis]